jgi:uncharacterized protein YciI
VYVLVLPRNGENAARRRSTRKRTSASSTGLSSATRCCSAGRSLRAARDLGAAYLLRCIGLQEAEAIAAEDPLVAHGVVRAECAEWELVGIDPAAIDPDHVV